MEFSTEKKILVVGDVMLDIYHFGTVERISPEAPVPVFLENKKISYSPGGAANVAVNISAIEVPTDVFSVIGEDSSGKKLEELLKEKNIGVSLLVKSEKRETTGKLRYIGQNNQQILRADSETIAEVNYEDLAPYVSRIADNINEYGIFLFSDYKKGFLTRTLSQKLISVAKKNNIPVFVDVKGDDYKKYENATLLKPNKKELSILTRKNIDSMEDVVEASEYLCKQASCNYVLTTLGAEGMMLVNRDGMFRHIPSVAREVFDVTGAGDTSLAYLAAETILGKSIENAIRIANIAAGIQVGKVGTCVVYPDEVRELSNKFNSEKIVFTNGCFDIIHAGHIAYLREARLLGDKLIVGINSDDSVKRLKGEDRPLNRLDDRISVLSSIKYVDEVIPFDEDTPLELIKRIHPDVLVKGGDYKLSEIVGADEVMSYGGTVKTLSFLKGNSTTNLIEKMKEALKKDGDY